jgi:hypothetical protein
MTRDPVKAIADAVLYEGYILWPYRRSALKNQRRFTFGGVYPPAHSEAHPDDPASMQTEVLLRADRATRVEITVRFLQVVRRSPARRGRGSQELELVDELFVDGERHLAWDEAVEREIRTPTLSVEELQAGRRLPIAIRAGREVEELGDRDHAGALIRTWRALNGRLDIGAAPAGADATRVSVRILNTTPSEARSREQALELTFCSTHTLLHAEHGAFVSLADPPAELAAAAAACRNVGTWPVLVGGEFAGANSESERYAGTMLSSPIILEDYPRVAPESPGDLFDGGEIDQLLVLNILALTDEEKAEMAASDPRAREILERAESLTPQQLMALHGTVRELGMAR